MAERHFTQKESTRAWAWHTGIAPVNKKKWEKILKEMQGNWSTFNMLNWLKFKLLGDSVVDSVFLVH